MHLFLHHFLIFRVIFFQQIYLSEGWSLRGLHLVLKEGTLLLSQIAGGFSQYVLPSPPPWSFSFSSSVQLSRSWICYFTNLKRKQHTKKTASYEGYSRGGIVSKPANRQLILCVCRGMILLLKSEKCNHWTFQSCIVFIIIGFIVTMFRLRHRKNW